MTDNERIAILELKVELLTDAVEKSTSKLDELLTFKSKGMGAFWLASTIFGTGLVGAIVAFTNWFKGV